jgi:integrase
MINAIEPHVSRQVWGLVQLALLTGARAGELVIMRSIDLDTSRDVWVYRPQAHKTQYAGRTREIFLGEKAQAVLKPFLSTRRLDAYMFSPREAEEERRVAAAARRKTPHTYGNVRGSNRVRKPRREPGDRYDVAAFAKAIARGCDAAFPLPAELAPRSDETLAQWSARLTPEQATQVKQFRDEHRWNPHRLRHNAATNIRREYGIETARIILGHASAGITEVYAEADHAKAVEAMRKLG